MTAASLIRIRRLRKTFLEGDKVRLIFERLDLDIRPGECVALLGRSGSGKSTLLNLIGGIDLPDSGEIWVDGQAITTLNELDRTGFRRRRVGFVFQFFNLIPTLTVEENLLLPLELNGLGQPEQRRQALQLLERVGLETRRNSFPERLSGGEQQRLAIVRALVHRPLLLLADEPTGNLDAETGNRVLELLLELHSQAGTTVVMVTHSREIAARADRVLLLEAGQVREVTL
ncbi:MAG: ABC transporter ATP-binding protein [Candidatus Competibacteraceae bacterium]